MILLTINMKPQTTALQLKALLKTLKNGFFRIYTYILVHYILDTCIKTIFYYYTNAIIPNNEDYVGIKFFKSETVHCYELHGQFTQCHKL